ncbi:hypothetical protein PS922_00799 [Pseudomonas fluorescens]|uniref:Uncharacterized protein n=1 Tax=Pseudomonas fluorescens TaxID=294 RepID=A0A5E7RA94_PSEFL|nr:hypothetical protein PS922_00799 [Pseudomonas fluorescens]
MRSRSMADLYPAEVCLKGRYIGLSLLISQGHDGSISRSRMWSNNDKIFRYYEAAPRAFDARPEIEARQDQKRLLH